MSRSFIGALTVGLLAFGLSPVAAGAQAPPQGQSSAAARFDAQSLHDSLHLTVAQEDAWRTYRRASAPDPGAASRHQAAMMMFPSLTTPRRVDLIAAEMQADLDAAKRAGEAVKAFYATLTPDQQRTFDRQTLQPSGTPADQLRQPAAGQALPTPRP
jgi:hypothetical protein